jgi:Fe-S-cluster containining protein
MIKDFGVSWQNPCEHLQDGKCSIYSDRPEVCRAFSCVWKSNFCDDSLKPDKSGAVAKWSEEGKLTILPIDRQVKNSTRNKWGRFAARHKVEMQVVKR